MTSQSIRRFRWVGGILLVTLIATSLWVTPPRVIELIDDGGAPVDIAYVAYEYIGHRPNFVHSVTYGARPLALARRDAGRISIPLAVHLHAPFPIKTHPSLWVELIYVPRLHNAWGQLNNGSPSRADVFTIESPGRRAIVSDLSGRPELWEGTLRNLASLIARLAFRASGEMPLRETDPATWAHLRELIAHFRREYDGFIGRYRDVERTRPPTPDYLRWSTPEEQRRWTEAVDRDRAREPKWGPFIARVYTDELRAFDRWLASPAGSQP